MTTGGPVSAAVRDERGVTLIAMMVVVAVPGVGIGGGDRIDRLAFPEGWH